MRYYVNGQRPNKEEVQFLAIPENSNQWKTKIKFSWTTTPFTNMATKRSRTNSRLQWVRPPVVEEEEVSQEKTVPQQQQVSEEQKQQPVKAEEPLKNIGAESNDTLEDLMKQSIASEIEEKEKQKQEKLKIKALTRKRIIRKENYIFIDEYASLQASDILDFYNIQNEEDYQELFPETSKKNNNNDKKKGKDKDSDNKSSKKSMNRRASVNTMRTSNTSGGESSIVIGPKVYATVTWMVFEIKAGIPFPQLVLLKESIQQFFDSIPQKYHSELYSEVRAEICVIGSNETSAKDYKDNGPGGPQRKKSSLNLVEMLLNTLKRESTSRFNIDSDTDQELPDTFLEKPKVLLVSLLYEKDLFQKIEEYLIGQLDVFLSRMVYSLNIEMNFLQSIPDMFSNSFHYYNLENKLFGPQELELMEKDLLNPLKYAKEIRSIKKSYEDIVQRIDEKTFTNKDELMKICKENGYFYDPLPSNNSVADLQQRVKSIYELKLELLNHGELNSYSKDVLKEIFYSYHINPENVKYAKENDFNMKFWEFNEFLYHSDIQTLYNKKEYELFAQNNVLYMDQEKQLSLNSFNAYYERIGHLMNDISSWKICNLDSFLTGVVHVSLNYDPNTLPGVLNNFQEKNPLFLNPFFKEMVKLMMIKDYSVEKRVNSVSEIIKELLPIDKLSTKKDEKKDNPGSADTKEEFDFKEFKEKLLHIFTAPGEFSQFINSIATFWNNGSEGVLPYLRKYLYEDFIQDNKLEIYRLYQPLERPNTAATASPAGGGAFSPFPLSSAPSFKDSNSNNSPRKRHSLSSRHSSSKKLSEPESVPEERAPDISLLETITFDPLKSENGKVKSGGKDEGKGEKSSFGGGGSLASEDQDSTVYYDTEDEAQQEINEVKERIIFDNLFTKYYLEEYEVLIAKAITEEDERVAALEEERLVLEMKQQALEEKKLKDRQEKEKLKEKGLEVLELTNITSKEQIEHDSLIDSLFSEDLLPEIIRKSDEEIQETVCYQLARAYLQLKPGLFESPTATDTGRTTEKTPSGMPNPSLDASSQKTTGSNSDNNKQQNWSKLKKQIISDLVFLFQIRLVSGINISLEESQEIEKKKAFLFQQLQIISTLEFQSFQELTKSFLMMYDCLRLFTTDFAHFGMGTKDFCSRMYFNNLFTSNQSNQLMSFLPKGLNELSPIQEYEKNKLQRYINRKMKALAAIEREKMRRNLTEEEKEKLKQEKLLKMKEEFIVEEKSLFLEAREELFHIREISIKNKEEVGEIIKLFENLVKLKESRFPLEYHTQIARNNLACVLYELYGLEHPLSECKLHF
jgi:hypothetical protein